MSEKKLSRELIKKLEDMLPAGDNRTMKRTSYLQHLSLRELVRIAQQLMQQDAIDKALDSAKPKQALIALIAGEKKLSRELIKKLEKAGFVSEESFKLLQDHLKGKDISSYFNKGVTAVGMAPAAAADINRFATFVEGLNDEQKKEIKDIELQGGGGYRKRKYKRRKSKRKKSKRRKSKRRTRNLKLKRK